jgi:hypothetical protein
MKKIIGATTLVWVMLFIVVSPSQAQLEDPVGYITDIPRDNLAQTGMKFLSVSLDPRAAAVGNAVTAREGSAMSMFYNPASMGWMDKSFDVTLGQTQWIGEIDYNYAGAAFKPAGGVYGTFGLSVVAVDYGDIQETIAFDNEQGYMQLNTFSPGAYAVGLTYGRVLTDRFSIGGGAKYASQSYGSVPLAPSNGGYERRDYSEGTMGFDFGIFYNTGFRSLTFAMSVRNLAPEVTYEEENFELPLTFRIGLAMNMLDFTDLPADSHELLFSVDAERPRDYPEHVKAGIEYVFLNTFALRAGYVLPTDEQGLNLGVGLQQSFSGTNVGASYAYSQFGRLGNVNRIGMSLGF